MDVCTKNILTKSLKVVIECVTTARNCDTQLGGGDRSSLVFCTVDGVAVRRPSVLLYIASQGRLFQARYRPVGTLISGGSGATSPFAVPPPISVPTGRAIQ